MVLKCEHCGSEFKRAPSNRRNSKHDFCNKECFGLWWADAKNHPPVTNQNTLANLRSDYWANPLISEERKQKTKDRLAEVMQKERINEKHPRWIPDRSILKDVDRNRGGQLHKEWTKSVKNRDNWNCRIANDDCSGRMEAHHILGWSSHPELRYEINNGITLCHAHHPRKRAEETRLAPVFQALVNADANNFCHIA